KEQPARERPERQVLVERQGHSQADDRLDRDSDHDQGQSVENHVAEVGPGDYPEEVPQADELVGHADHLVGEGEVQPPRGWVYDQAEDEEERRQDEGVAQQPVPVWDGLPPARRRLNTDGGFAHEKSSLTTAGRYRGPTDGDTLRSVMVRTMSRRDMPAR